MKKAFLFDTNRCTGCDACRLACAVENGLAPGKSWRQIQTYNPHRHPEVALFHLSLACNHCEEAPCLQACPARAYSRDNVTGAIEIDTDLCIGCRYCEWACPYGAPLFDEDTGVMRKCTFCNERLIDQLKPACVAGCPTDALQCVDREEHRASPSARGFPQRDVGAALALVSLRQSRRPGMRVNVERYTSSTDLCAPQITAPSSSHAVTELFPTVLETPPSGISLQKEWPLAVFTLLAAILVAILGTALRGALGMEPLPFFILGMCGFLLSASHLGQKRRAWRAGLGVGSSWLSREVLFYGFMLFFFSLTTALAILQSRSGTLDPAGAFTTGAIRALPWVALIAGIAALYCMDRVYDCVRPARFPSIHSADVLLTGTLLFGILTQERLLLLALVVVKGLLYIHRWKTEANAGHGPYWKILRLSLGLAVPLTLCSLDPERFLWIAFFGVAAGETLDRCEFYEDLEITSPAGEMAKEFRTRIEALT